MKYITLLLLFFALSCNSQKKVVETKTKETVKTEKATDNELIVVLKYPNKMEEAKQLIENSGLTWEKLIFDQENTKIALIKVPAEKRDFWLERLMLSGDFKSVELNKTVTINNIKEALENTFIAFKKTECFGKCPSFEVRVSHDGNLFFNGIKNTLVTGKKEFKLTEKQFSDLKKVLEKTTFSEYKYIYDNPRLMDAPSTYITNNQKEIQLRVWDNVPSELKNICNYIEELLISKKLYEH